MICENYNMHKSILGEETTNMVAKIWKKVLFIIFLVACLFNVVNKLVHKASLEEELQSSAEYVLEQQQEEDL